MMNVRALLLAGFLAAAPGSIALAQTSDDGGAAASQQSGGEIENRLQQLEEQLLDMQVQAGTAQSLAKGNGSAGEGLRTTAGGDIEERVRGMEMQVQGLASQLQQLARQMKALEARVGGAGGLQANSFEGTADATEPAAEEPSFGQTVIEPSGGAATGGGSSNDSAVESGDLIGNEIASLDAAGDPNQAYEEAYGYMLQQDYASAEHAFAEFLARHPKSKLAGNAQFWLGESFYVRGQYKQAADSFLKGYKGYKQSQKAPDSLLKLSMSLARLGEQKAACAGFSRLDTEFPNASAQVKGRAVSERQRAGC